MKVPIYTPNVSLRPDLRQDVQQNVTPEQMGADIGRGLQALGRGVSDVSDAMVQVQRVEDEASAREARNNFLLASDELKYGASGGPASGGQGATLAAAKPGYMTTSGAAAIKGFDKHTRSIEALRLEHGKGLSRGAAALYKKATDPLIIDAKRSALRHRAAARKQFVRENLISSAEQFKTQAVQNFGDPALREKYLNAGVLEIGNLGVAEGWSKLRIRQQQEAFRSDTLRLQALHLAQEDPIAAAAYVHGRRREMAPDVYLTTQNAILPQLGVAVGRDAVNMASPTDAELAASGVPKAAHSLLAVIGSTERPSQIEPEDVEQAGATAGRETAPREAWRRSAEALDLPADAAASQTQAGWWTASRQYRGTTGRSLEDDLKAGNLKAVREGLSETYAGVRRMTDKDFAVALTKAAAPADATLRFSPPVDALLKELPAHMAERVRAVAQNGLDQHRSQQVSRAKAHRLSVVDDFKLRIATGDEALTAQEILDNPALDNGDRATLITSFEAKRGDEIKARRAVAAFQAGRLQVDPYSADGKKTVDAAFGIMVGAVEPEKRAALLGEFVRQTGLVPDAALHAMRADINSPNPRAVASAAGLAMQLRAIDPAALERRDGGKEVDKAAVEFRYFTQTLGMTPAAAAQKIIALGDPEKKREREALRTAKTTTKFLKDQATEANVRDVFDPGWFGFDPKLGETPLASTAAVAEYRDMLGEALFEANGDQSLAKEKAAAAFRRRYSTSEFSIQGKKTVVRLPPELTYRPDANGGHGYIREQAKKALGEAGVTAGEVFLQADDVTEQDVSAGRPPRYRLLYKTEAGALEQHQHRFFAVAPTQAEIDAAKRTDREARHRARRDELEAIQNMPIGAP